MSYKTYEVKVYDDGRKDWFLNDQRHREDGPAIEWADGKEWWINGQRHREDGPAIEWADGSKYWWLNGKRHREDGPAAEYADGNKEWWLNGKYFGEVEFNEQINPQSHAGTEIVVDGKKYKLVETE